MKTYGILGKNIEYTLSPYLHKIIFKKIGIDANYEIYDGKFSKNEDMFLKNILEKIKLKEISGISVTIPFKEKIMKYLEEIDEIALSIGAVNTIVLENGKLKGYNTDYYGIIESLKKLGVTITNEKVYILGTGGAAKAVIKVIEELKGVPILVSRNKEKIKIGIKNYDVINYEMLGNIEIGKLLIDTTPVPLVKEMLKKFEYIFQLKYQNKGNDILCIDNDYKSENYIDGHYMLGIQGLVAEEIWQGVEINGFEEIYMEFLEKKISEKE